MIKVGEKASITKKFSQEEVDNYSKLSNDNNPLHNDLTYAAKTIFQKPIVQGLLVSSLFGGLLGSKNPGHGTIHLGQNLRFMKPVYIDENIKASIELIRIRKDKPILTFKCIVEKEDNSVAITGEAVVMYKE